MSAPSAKWSEFYRRHGERKYTPTFNSFLEAAIADREAPLSERVWSWMLRRAWGNHSDCCVDGEGITLTQTDCARELGITDAKGKPDRRTVNPIFQEFARRRCVRFVGQEIHPVDDPAEASTFASSSLDVGNGTDFCPETASVSAFVEQVWGPKHPVEYQEYQKTRQRLKELNLAILGEWKAFRKMSETGPTFEETNVGDGSDKMSGTDPTNGGPILIGFKPLNSEAAAAVLPTFVGEPAEQNAPPPLSSYELPEPEKAVMKVTAALAQYEAPERGDVLQLIDECRKRDPQATADEIVDRIRQKGIRWRGPGLAFFLQYVPPCFPLTTRAVAHPVNHPPPPENPDDANRWRKEQAALLDDPAVSEQEKRVIRQVLGIEEPAKTKAQKAGTS